MLLVDWNGMEGRFVDSFIALLSSWAGKLVGRFARSMIFLQIREASSIYR